VSGNGFDVLAPRDLPRGYGDTVALDGLSLDVPEGEVVGFVGRNGAGKTTAMRTALGVLEADSGEVSWRDRPVDRHAQSRFGYLREERGLLSQVIASIALLVPLVARVYEGAVLRTGRPLKLVEAWRAART
jgi:ABC-type uncharacterized transport system ATPase subunit